jgi:hypothetical protein
MCDFLYLKKQKIKGFMVKIKIFFPLQPLGIFSHMVASRSSSKITRKIIIIQGN